MLVATDPHTTKLSDITLYYSHLVWSAYIINATNSVFNG